MSGFTPGPWEWSDAGRLFHNVPGSHSSNVLVVHDEAWRPMPNDARLIAAAPKLYEALEWAMTKINRPTLVPGQNDEHFRKWEAAHAALATVRGDQ